jgi:DNA invertase Pin-like site-specific DNA recombinase
MAPMSSKPALEGEGAVAIVTRASLDREDKRISIDRQEARCRRLADELCPGVEVRVFPDNDKSGSDPDVHRPGYEAFVAAVRRGEIGVVVVHEQSRLTRIPEVWNALVVTLTKAGITKIHTVQQGTISVEAGNRLVGGILNLVDAEESERIKARATAMAEQLAAEGRPQGGRFYGYRRHRGPDGAGRPELEIVPEQAEVIRRITDELLGGHSARAVAEHLNADRVPTARAAAEWRGSSVMAIARKPHIAGLRTHHGTVVGPATWEPIISPERFEALQAATVTATVVDVAGQRRRIGRARADNSRKWLLTGGIARCSLCQAPLVVAKLMRPGGYITGYACSKRSGNKTACGGLAVAPAELVEELIVERVKERLSNPTFAALLHHSDDSARNTAAVALAEARARVRRIDQLFSNGDVDEERWREMQAPAKARAEAARAQLAATEPPDIDLPPADVVRDGWEELPLKARQEVLRRYLKAVWVLSQDDAARRAKAEDPGSGARPADPRMRVAMRLDPEWLDAPRPAHARSTA